MALTRFKLSALLLVFLAVPPVADARWDDKNRMTKSVYLSQIKEWSNYDPASIDAAVKQLLQIGESFELNGLHFDAAASQISGGRWVADCVEENTGTSHRTGAYGDAQTAMTNCIDDLRSTIVVSVAETINKGTSSLTAKAQQLWVGARDMLQRARVRAEQSQQQIHDKYKEYAETATRRAQETMEAAKEGAHTFAEKTREAFGVPSTDEMKEQYQEAKLKAGQAFDETKWQAKEKLHAAGDQARSAYDDAKFKARQGIEKTKSNVGDMYETAKESANAAKDTVKNKASSVYEDTKAKVKENVDTAGRGYENLKESASEMYEDAKDTAAMKAREAKLKAQEAYDSGKEHAKTAYDAAKEATMDAYERTKDSTAEKLEQAKDTAAEKLEQAKAATTEKTEASKSKFSNMFHKASDMVGNIAERAGVWKHRVGDDAKDAAQATKEFAQGTTEEVAGSANAKEGL